VQRSSSSSAPPSDTRQRAGSPRGSTRRRSSHVGESQRRQRSAAATASRLGRRPSANNDTPAPSRFGPDSNVEWARIGWAADLVQHPNRGREFGKWDDGTWADADGSLTVEAVVAADGVRVRCSASVELTRVSGGVGRAVGPWSSAGRQRRPGVGVVPATGAVRRCRLFRVGKRCRSAKRSCIAVGFSVGASGREVPFAERWNGSSWSILRTVNPIGVGGQLSAISCPSAGFCVAVGSGPGGALFERWNGSRWSLQHPAGLEARSELDGVSCPSRRACVAVGAAGRGAAAELWDGRRWSRLGRPQGVGGLKANGPEMSGPLLERWGGTSWSAAKPPPCPYQFGSPQLFGVSCASAATCTSRATREDPAPRLVRGSVPCRRQRGHLYGRLTPPSSPNHSGAARPSAARARSPVRHAGDA